MQGSFLAWSALCSDSSFVIRFSCLSHRSTSCLMSPSFSERISTSSLTLRSELQGCMSIIMKIYLKVKVIINLLMRLIIVLLLGFLLVTLGSGMHVLKDFDQDVGRIRQHFKAGDTSRVFSILMKMLYQTSSLYQELGLPHPHVVSASDEASCNQMLHQLVSLFGSATWAEIYQQIYPRLHRIQQKCTNADFIELGPDNGFDDKCALCSVLSRVIENYITYHRKDVAKFVEQEFCTLFDGLLKPSCEAFVHYAGPYIIKGLLNKENTDVICHGSGMCKKPECKILDTRSQNEFEEAINRIFNPDEKISAHTPSPWKWLVHIFVDNFGNQHLPPFDLDNDTFSDISTFRGYHWKGADCNELDPKVYPGRKTGNSKKDHDCNGIFGTDQKGKSLEDKLCGNTTRLGVVVAGDSAGAHFSIPEKFFNVTMMQHGTFKDLLPRIADQFDLPYESAYTGHTNTTYVSHSIYKKLRKWNVCNNNDFQNIAVNGGDSGNTWGNIKALKRDQNDDHPVLFFLQLIGNDVCGSSPSGYTPLDHFKANILKLLNWLDTALPKGSHVVILGLADGDLLFDNLHGTIHPLDVTYDQVYDFLNCLKISPCAGWLNTDHDIRLRTTAWAKKLSQQYKDIIAEGHTFKNFDYVYYDFPTQDMFKKAYLENREPREMIQRCDGFHPSGLFNSYLADWLWFKITTEHPEWVGEENPHNEEIKKIFGLWDLQ